MNVLQTCLFCQHFEDYHLPTYQGLCHNIIQYDEKGNLLDIEPKLVLTYEGCQKHISVYDAELTCKNKFYKLYETKIKWETCLMCEMYKKCWEPAINPYMI